MSTLTAELATLLGEVRRPGDFYASGTVAFFAPRIVVDGVGAVALPLLPAQAEQLIAAAERAPYGRGEDTLVDTAVRRTWQIAADRVHIAGKHWPDTLAAILAKVADGLGLTEPAKAEFYKLLIYDPGSFFVDHRDTEKAPGMFATLVIVLPGDCVGGELVVRHRGREARLDLHSDEPSELAFAAFYADCVHEVLPVAEGCRLTLVYNLIRAGRGSLPEPPSYEREAAQIMALLQDWSATGPAPPDDAPKKLIYPLEHAYTQAELGFESLKGADAAAAGVLVAAAERSGCELHLALLSIEESGAAECVYRPRSGRGRWSDEDGDDFEAGEVYDRQVYLAEWRRPDGEPSPLNPIPVEDDELSPPDAVDGMAPDQEHFREASGNEGASFERTYRRAALVLWPRSRFLAVLNQAGLPVTLPYLDHVTADWAAAGGGRDSPLWAQAHELAGHMVADIAGQRWLFLGETERGATRLFTLLTRLGDGEHIAALLDRIAEIGEFGAHLNPAIIAALALMPPEDAAAMIERLVAATAAASLGACANLLRRAADTLPTASRPRLAGAAARLVEALPGELSAGLRLENGLYRFGREPKVDSRTVVDVITALGSIDPALAERATQHVLAWPRTYGFDSVLVAAAATLAGDAAMRDAPAVERLRSACLAHLEARIAEPLAPPADWARPGRLDCSCPKCRDLSAFLADPGRQSWTLRAVEHERSHVESTIRQANCDLDCRTERRGRPYSLICTKNQASYDRRVEQRHRDLADRTRLAG